MLADAPDPPAPPGRAGANTDTGAPTMPTPATRPPSGGADGPDPREAILPLLPPLRGYARALAGDASSADDLVQDTVVLALQAWHRFTPGTNLRAWLFRILHNRHLTVRTRRHVTAEVGVDDLSLHGSVPAFQEDRAELRQLAAAVARLRPRHREVLVLHAVHGLPYGEIAEVTGCEVGTVKSRINRARTVLKAMLLGDEGEGPRRERSGGGGVRPGERGSPSRVV
jgi:RNA polymerase sigma-70 factor, ECF subfamily